MRLPFIKFYPRDWTSDPQLRMVSLAARGLWFECLCLMHMGQRRGYLETPNGKPINVECLCRLSGTYKGDVEALMVELVDHGIPSIEAGTGIWYSRRMVKDESKRAKCAEAGKRGGGNPSLNPPQKERPKRETRDHISIKVSYKGDLYRSYVVRLNALYKRRDTTEWSDKEKAALASLMKRSAFADELERIESYFSDMRADGRGQFLRHDLQTLLNNWAGELDRAAVFNPENTIKKKPKTPYFEYERVLNDIVCEVRKRPRDERRSYLESCADKFGDTPTPAGYKKVWIRAREIATSEGLLK